METPIITTHSTAFRCEQCDYNCKSEQTYNKHLLTSKHINGPNEINCPCGKVYKTKQGLMGHMKKCKEGPVEKVGNEKVGKEKVGKEKVGKVGNEKAEKAEKEKEKKLKKGIESITDSYEAMRKENLIFKTQLLDYISSSKAAHNALALKANEIKANELKENEFMNSSANTNTTTTTTTTDCHQGNNEVYNIKIYLNDKCKDPRKMAEFVKNLINKLDKLDKTNKLDSTCDLEIDYTQDDDDEDEDEEENDVEDDNVGNDVE